MNEAIEKAIQTVLGGIRTNTTKADDALKFSQAALNLAHAKATLAVIQETGSKSKGSG